MQKRKTQKILEVNWDNAAKGVTRVSPVNWQPRPKMRELSFKSIIQLLAQLWVMRRRLHLTTSTTIRF